MNEEALVNRRMVEWKRLEELCSKADVRLKSLSKDEFFEFIKLYKRASTDLSSIRTRSSNEPLVHYLNNLVVRAHGILYRRPHKNIGQAIFDSINEIARCFRRNKVFFWVSFAIFFGAAILGFVLVTMDRSYLGQLAPGSRSLFEGWKDGSHDERSMGEGAMMSFFYAGNNPRVSIITGAIGAGTMGTYSIYLLFTNGALLGALASEMQSVNKLWFLISSIAPHGVPELSGIIFSGAAGIKFGWAIFFPGVYSRAESLRRAGKDGVILIITGVLLCFIAAPIEGFFSFNPKIPQALKAVFAVVTLILWIGFWSFFGKEDNLNESRIKS